MADSVTRSRLIFTTGPREKDGPSSANAMTLNAIPAGRGLMPIPPSDPCTIGSTKGR